MRSRFAIQGYIRYSVDFLQLGNDGLLGKLQIVLGDPFIEGYRELGDRNHRGVELHNERVHNPFGEVQGADSLFNLLRRILHIGLPVKINIHLRIAISGSGHLLGFAFHN
ncbi:hypothetical protein D3C75_879050 [compost metagenome]